MNKELTRDSPIYSPSNFWITLNNLHLEKISSLRLENFKRTINQMYFNWVPLDFKDNQYNQLLRYWSQNPSVIPLQTSIDTNDLLFVDCSEKNPFLLDPDYKDLYRFFVGMLWQYALDHDPEKIGNRISEPDIGNPLRIYLKDKLISQDLANSLRERSTMTEYIKILSNSKTPVIAELGAGYGRLAYAFLAGGPCRYFIFDIPPALNVAQWYLTKVFPNHRIFNFRPFQSFYEIADEVESADIAFFTANQIELFPENYFDAFANISSLHEMTHAQIDHYKAIIQKITRFFVYFKQWKKTFNSLDNIELLSKDYLLSSPWKLLLNREDTIQNLFQEQGFVKLKSS